LEGKTLMILKQEANIRKLEEELKNKSRKLILAKKGLEFQNTLLRSMSRVEPETSQEEKKMGKEVEKTWAVRITNKLLEEDMENHQKRTGTCSVYKRQVKLYEEVEDKKAGLFKTGDGVLSPAVSMDSMSLRRKK